MAFLDTPILVMDDDASIRKLFSFMLEYLGYASVCSCEGDEALSLYKQARDDGTPFTRVILDLHNHLGKGGMETILDLQELDPKVNAIICSADIHAPVMNQFQVHGFKDALAKPFGLDDLDNILKDTLCRKE